MHANLRSFLGSLSENTGKSSPAVLEMLLIEAGGRLRGTSKKVVFLKLPLQPQ